jgi:hypothetical protein
MRRPQPVCQHPIRFLVCQIPAWLGMVIYALINVLFFFGCFSALWIQFGREPQPFTAYLSAFMFPAGTSALLLAPLAYGLLRWRCGSSEQPVWRQKLLPLWMGVVTYSGLSLPLIIIVSFVPRFGLHGWPAWLDTVLVAGEVMGLATLSFFLLQWRWFAAGLLLGYTLSAGGVVAWGRLFLGDMAWGYSLVVGYGACIGLLLIGIIVSAIREALLIPRATADGR